MVWLYIAVGGGIGALARYGVGEWVRTRSGFDFPWGTFAVNILGALLIGVAVRYFDVVRIGPEVRALVGVGLLGAFTTFSTFSYETVRLLEQGAWAKAVAYSAGSVVLGLVAVYAGMIVVGAVERAMT